MLEQHQAEADAQRTDGHDPERDGHRVIEAARLDGVDDGRQRADGIGYVVGAMGE